MADLIERGNGRGNIRYFPHRGPGAQEGEKFGIKVIVACDVVEGVHQQHNVVALV